MPTIAARVFPYLSNVLNTAKGEGRNPAKYDDRDGVMVDITDMAEMPAYRYANGVNCPDDTGASTNLILSIRLRASAPDGANYSEGLIYVGETFWVHYDNGGNSAWWRGICAADNYLVITIANLQYGVNPANYAGLVGSSLVHIRVSNGGYWKLAAADLAVGIITGMINMADAQVMKANSTSPTSGAGTYWTPATAAEVAMNALCTSHDREHTLAGNHRANVITYANLAETALQTVRVNLLAPFGEMFPTPIAGGIYYPPGWRPQVAAPSACAAYTTLADLLGNANLLAITMDASTAQGIKSNMLAPDQARVQGFRNASVQLYVSLKKTGASGAGKAIIYVNDNVTGDTAYSITPTTTMTTYSLTTAAVISATATTMEVGIKHDGADAAACSLLINEFWAEITAPIKWFAENPYFRVHKIQMSLAGNMAAGPTYFLFDSGCTSSTTFGPKVAGKIVGCAFDVQLGTAVAGAGSTIFDIRLNGGTVATLTLAGASAATQDAAAYTPTTPPTIGVPAVYGARFMVRCTAIAATPGTDATFTGYAITLS